MATITEAQAVEIRKWARQYRDWGFQPIPSDPTDRKKPFIRYSDLWERPIGYDPFEKFPLSNIQLMAGCYWGLVVIDLDGPEARDQWKILCRGRKFQSWEVRSGGGGTHFWFSTPRGMESLSTSRLWGVWDAEKSGWEKGKAIELLCDRKLIMAPPSIHPATSRVYNFNPRQCHKQNPRPPVIPDWILDLAPLPSPASTISLPGRASPSGLPGTQLTTQQILEAIHDKEGLARQWGLKIVGRANSDGWAPCHIFWREDRDPSASFSPSSGRYWDPETGTKGISFIELGVRLGIFSDYQDGRNTLAATYVTHTS